MQSGWELVERIRIKYQKDGSIFLLLIYSIYCDKSFKNNHSVLEYKGKKKYGDEKMNKFNIVSFTVTQPFLLYISGCGIGESITFAQSDAQFVVLQATT